MSLLAPLYIAGLLAIALPIVFHLIRRAPQGRQDFSSLMFLSPSPPTLTKRSRLTNILLLLLRAAALALLAFAFARPFLRQDANAAVTETTGRRVAILIDTSASLRRGDAWTQAKSHADEAIKSISPIDEAAMFVFDRTVRPVLNFEEWNRLEPSRRIAAMQFKLSELSPTWDQTRLGDAVTSVADQLSAGESRTDRSLILISDMQRGGRIEALQGHDWPKNVALTVKPVVVDEKSNASMTMVKDSADDPDAKRLRVRVNNEPGGDRDQFTLTFANANGPIAGGAPVSAYVPPGNNQVVRIPWPVQEQNADRLLLFGDGCDFDNVLYVVPPAMVTFRVIYLGGDTPNDTKGLLFYVQSALADTPRRRVEFLQKRPAESLADVDLVDAGLIIVAGNQTDDRIESLQRFASAGGDILWVLQDTESAGAISTLISDPALRIEESSGKQSALIARVEFDHPLFALFSDARFSDFSKIHFWKHRKITLTDRPGTRVLARFDTGDPFLVEHVVGTGRVFLMTSGWQPADSQLALSTKFVPMLEGLLARRDASSVDSQFVVHQPIPNSPFASEGATEPGIVTVSTGGKESRVAVNLASDESRTAPIAVEDLEQWGVRLAASGQTALAAVERQRHLQSAELENRQKMWRWLIVGVLVLLATETALAGRLARRPVASQVQA